MSNQQPQASTAVCSSAAAEEGSNRVGCEHLVCSTDSSCNNAVSYVQSKTRNKTDGLQVSIKEITHNTSPNEICTANNSFNEPPINLINSCNMQAADTQDQLPIQEVCYHNIGHS